MYCIDVYSSCISLIFFSSFRLYRQQMILFYPTGMSNWAASIGSSLVSHWCLLSTLQRNRSARLKSSGPTQIKDNLTPSSSHPLQCWEFGIRWSRTLLQTPSPSRPFPAAFVRIPNRTWTAISSSHVGKLWSPWRHRFFMVQNCLKEVRPHAWGRVQWTYVPSARSRNDLFDSVMMSHFTTKHPSGSTSTTWGQVIAATSLVWLCLVCAPLPLICHLSWSFLQGLGVSAVVDTAMADALDSMSAEATSDVGNSHRKSKTEEKSPVTWYEQVNLVREFVQNAQFPFSFPRIYHEMSWCSMMFQSHKDIHRSFKPRFPTIFVSQAFQTEFESLTSFGTLFGDALKTADTFGCVAVGHPKKKNITKMCQTFLTNKWRWWVYHLTCLTGCFKKKIYRGDLPHHRFHLLDSLALSRWNLSFGKWWEALGVRNWKISKIEGNFQPESAVPAYTTQIGVAE